MLIVERVADALVARPILWGSYQELRRVQADSFVVVDNPLRTLTFQLDGRGCAEAVSVKNIELSGVFPKLETGEQAPVERIISGDIRGAVRAFHSEPMSVPDYTRLAGRLAGLPTQAVHTRDFLAELIPTLPASADLLALLGRAHIAVGERERARDAFARALRLDSTYAEANAGARRLGARPPGDSGWSIPFPLTDLFRAPDPAERLTVERRWAERDLSYRGVDSVGRERIAIPNDSATAIVVAHPVHGQRHYGTIIIPDHRGPRCCGVVLDLKGIGWNFPPLSVPEGLLSPRSLGAHSSDVIYVVPSMPGEVLSIGGKSFTSEGDRTNGWDGGADAAIALLEVAFRVTSLADSSRVCAFGHSRGGSVALLVGERSQRVSCVVAMAPPMDWFRSMSGGSPGWTPAEVVGEALTRRAAPNTEGGQFIERFLLPAIDGRWTLADARLRMLAASPLYFAARLPRTQVHFGVEDGSVPSANGRALERAMRALGRRAPRFEAFFYEHAGHDTDRPRALRKIAPFLARELRLEPAR